MQFYKTNKIVLRIKNNPIQFLNGITSNAFDQPRNAFLNIHGRIVAAFDQIQINDDEFWIIVELPYVDPLLTHIDRYIKLSKAEVAKLNKFVYFDLSGESSSIAGATVSILQKKGKLIISDSDLESTVLDEEFTLFRLRNNIPMQGKDFNDEFILNVSEEDFVSFAKGCFLGQEPVSKVHNRSKPSWKLKVQYEDECQEDEKKKMTSKILDPESNRVLGFVFTRND